MTRVRVWLWHLSSERKCEVQDRETDELGESSKDNAPPWVPVRPLCRSQGRGSGRECSPSESGAREGVQLTVAK